MPSKFGCSSSCGKFEVECEEVVWPGSNIEGMGLGIPLRSGTCETRLFAYVKRERSDIVGAMTAVCRCDLRRLEGLSFYLALVQDLDNGCMKFHRHELFTEEGGKPGNKA